MKHLSYQTLKEIGYDGYLLKEAPERVLQFGEGNFLRAFVEDFIDRMNESAGFASKVVLVQPRPPVPSSRHIKESLNRQDGLYTLYLRGSHNGQKVNRKRIISCVSRCLNAYADYDALMECAQNPDLRFLTCNTTEAGIVYDASCRFTDRPASSFPGKLTQFLYRRFQVFGSVPGKGFLILPCELIDDNGAALQDCVLRYARQWELGEAFLTWLLDENLFCSTLVDRIVTGFPKEEIQAMEQENGYIDEAADTGEVFGSWIIEGNPSIAQELPFEKAGLPIQVVADHHPYKQRKVRILNGAHTSMVLGAYLAGWNIVRDCMEDEGILSFMNRALYQEIIPTLSLPEKECKDFADSVVWRFRNPYIDHALLSISLNSTSKWRARVLPSLTGYLEKTGQLPPCLTASLAFYVAFYHGLHACQEQRLTDEGLVTARPDGEEYIVKDDRKVLEFFYEHRADGPEELTHAVLSRTDFWGMDLTALPGLETQVAADLACIQIEGPYQMMKKRGALS